MSTPDAVIIDANVLVSICSKEQGTYPIAYSAFGSYAEAGWEFFAPNVIVAEAMFALCVKFKSLALTQMEYDRAIESFSDLMQVVSAPIMSRRLLNGPLRSEAAMSANEHPTASISRSPKNSQNQESSRC